jgi:hypothetical protein
VTHWITQELEGAAGRPRTVAIACSGPEGEDRAVYLCHKQRDGRVRERRLARALERVVLEDGRLADLDALIADQAEGVRRDALEEAAMEARWDR